MLRRNRGALVGLCFVALEVVVAISAGAISPHDPLAQAITQRLRPPLWVADSGQSFILGTDQLGRDVLSRIIWGSRVSLIIGVIPVLVSAPVGVALGLIAGYYGRSTDHVIMRLADIQLAFPFVLLAIAIIAVLGPEPINIVLVLGISGWVLYARIVRGEVLTLKRQPFVESARVVGLTDRLIMLRYLLPNVMPAVIVVATFAVAYMILLESSLSFLGLGVQPPAPTWGGMLSEGREYISNAWWLSILPGLAIMLTVLSINFVGDWLRDILDPRVQP
jgi:peptide/nickel transport system permease protein